MNTHSNPDINLSIAIYLQFSGRLVTHESSHSHRCLMLAWALSIKFFVYRHSQMQKMVSIAIPAGVGIALFGGSNKKCLHCFHLTLVSGALKFTQHPSHSLWKKIIFNSIASCPTSVLMLWLNASLGMTWKSGEPTWTLFTWEAGHAKPLMSFYDSVSTQPWYPWQLCDCLRGLGSPFLLHCLHHLQWTPFHSLVHLEQCCASLERD